MKKEGTKREIEIKIRLNEEENKKIEDLAEKLKMSKGRLIRNIILGEIKDINMLYNIGLLPIIQNVTAYYQKNFKGEDYWDMLKRED